MSARRYRNKSRRGQREQRKQTVRIIMIGILFIILGIYANWDSNNIAEPLASESTIRLGEQLYMQSCAVCHGNRGEGHADVAQAPALNGDEHAWHHADGQLQEIILSGGVEMPSFQEVLTNQEVAAVIRYFQTMWRSDQLQAQQANSAQNPLRE